jgi:type III secretory pathway component EscS
MDVSFHDVFERGFQVVATVALPAFAVPVVSFIFSLVQAFFGLQDEGVAYAIRIAAMVGIAFAVAPGVAQSIIELMAWTLQ